MNKLLPQTIALIAGSVISYGTVHGQFVLPDKEGTPPVTTVSSFSTQGRASAVLKGERGTASVGGDTIELKDRAVYVNGVSYGPVASAQTVEYDVTRDKRTLQVDGKVRSPVR
jgi:hypothetical protein